MAESDKTITVALPASLDHFISEEVKAGRYSSPSEVVGDAVARLMRRQRYLEWMDAEVNIGIQAAERGEFVDGEQFFDQLEREMLQRRKKSA